MFVTIIKQFPKASVGTATGFINSIAQIGSFLSPLMIGYLLKLTQQNYATAFLSIIACVIALSITHSTGAAQAETTSNVSQ
ncbi:hypothetical protein [Enterobacter hormaechei]|uniref:hypothetical protein n=1 Tax=Enterobacter hormaechei TaxID=158836 RepID=UPI001652C5FF|nr:hypothetical protein [Enterobacter hormaechei]